MFLPSGLEVRESTLQEARCERLFLAKFWRLAITHPPLRNSRRRPTWGILINPSRQSFCFRSWWSWRTSNQQRPIVLNSKWFLFLPDPPPHYQTRHHPQDLDFEFLDGCIQPEALFLCFSWEYCLKFLISEFFFSSAPFWSYWWPRGT
jgi:hypothetical protein